MKVGDRVKVMETAPYHTGKEGYIRGFGSSPAAMDSVIVAEIPGKKTPKGHFKLNDFLFIVEKKYLILTP